MTVKVEDPTLQSILHYNTSSTKTVLCKPMHFSVVQRESQCENTARMDVTVKVWLGWSRRIHHCESTARMEQEDSH